MYSTVLVCAHIILYCLSCTHTQSALAETEGELVGEGDGTGFAVGVVSLLPSNYQKMYTFFDFIKAPSSLKHPTSPVMLARKAKMASRKDSKPPYV